MKGRAFDQINRKDRISTTTTTTSPSGSPRPTPRIEKSVRGFECLQIRNINLRRHPQQGALNIHLDRHAQVGVLHMPGGRLSGRLSLLHRDIRRQDERRTGQQQHSEQWRPSAAMRDSGSLIHQVQSCSSPQLDNASSAILLAAWVM